MKFSRALWARMQRRLIRHVVVVTVTLACLVALLCTRPASGASVVADVMMFFLLSTLMYQAYVMLVMVGLLFSAGVEVRRKTAHVLGGGVLVVGAWLTATSAVVVALCVVLLIWLVATRALPTLEMYRQVSVHRRDGSASWGDLLFPIGLGATAMLFGAQSAEWLAAALVLTLADSTAAVVGSRFPGALYRIGRASKSLGGTTAFFMVAWLSIALVGWVCAPDWPWLACAGVAALATGLEAIASRGADNLVLPLATAAGLVWISIVPPLAWLIAGTACLMVLAALAVWQRSIGGAAHPDTSRRTAQ